MKATLYANADFHQVNAGELIVVFNRADVQDYLYDDKKDVAHKLAIAMRDFLKATPAVSSHLRQQRRPKPPRG